MLSTMLQRAGEIYTIACAVLTMHSTATGTLKCLGVVCGSKLLSLASATCAGKSEKNRMKRGKKNNIMIVLIIESIIQLVKLQVCIFWSVGVRGGGRDLSLLMALTEYNIMHCCCSCLLVWSRMAAA